MIRLLVTGSRKWTNNDVIREALTEFQELCSMPVILTEGEAPGADKIAAAIGKQLGMRIDPYPAKWKEHDPEYCTSRCKSDGTCYGAGKKRNQVMLDTHPNYCVAFHKSNSPGTADMLERVIKKGIPFSVYTA